MQDSKFGTYLQPAFLICVAVLGIAGASMSITIKKLGIYLAKEPLPLKSSLDFLDEKDLGPYKVVSKFRIDNEEVIKELGTRDFAQLLLEDREVEPDSVVRRFMLFITYYELPDIVLHVPEECYMGGGYEKLAFDSVTFEINKDDLEDRIRGKYLFFGRSKHGLLLGSDGFPVLYLFNVNGVYVGGREEVRVVLNKNIFGKYSYVSKVEMAFNQTRVAPSKKEAVEACEKLLAVVLPILEEQHWPDWEQ